MNLQIQPIPELQSWASVRGNGLLLANGLGVKPPTVSDWVTGKKRIPLDKVMPIERLTDGAVTRRHMRPHDYLIHWPELAKPQAEPAPIAIETVADAHAAIKHVEAVAVAEIKHVAEELLKDDAPWDGVNDRRDQDAPWDGITERRKLNSPIERRISPASVARAKFLQAQQVSTHERLDIPGAGQGG